MGIYRFSNGVVRGIRNVDCRMRLLSNASDAVVSAVLSAEKPAAKDPLRTADTTTMRLDLAARSELGRLASLKRRGEG